MLSSLLRFPIHLAGAVAAGPFGLRRALALLVATPVLLAAQGVHAVALLLDELWFPAYRDIEVREPLFVVGLPRSGTSQMQEILADDPRFTSTRLWQLLLAPAICERRLVARLVALDTAVGGPGAWLVDALQRVAFRFLDDVHPVRLDEPEEDYFLLWPFFACFLLVVPFPRSARVWSLVDIDDWPAAARRRLAGIYRRMVQRHLHESGARATLLSKNPSFTPFVRTLLEEFPDARVAGCVRDPLRVVPSLLSSLEDGARIFGWSPARPEYRDRLLSMLRDFGDRLLEYERDLRPGRYRILVLRHVRADLVGSVADMYAGFGWSLDPEFRAALEDRAGRARSHRSRHTYALSDYGLESDDVASRFPDLMTRFGFATDGAPAPNASETSNASTT